MLQFHIIVIKITHSIEIEETWPIKVGEFTFVLIF